MRTTRRANMAVPLLCSIMADVVVAEGISRWVLYHASSCAPGHCTLGNVLVARCAFGAAIDGDIVALELAPLASDA